MTGTDAMGAAAGAAARVARVIEQFAGIGEDDLLRITLPQPDEATRRDLLDRAAAAAQSSDRLALLADARHEALDVALRRFGAGVFHPTWLGLNWGRSLGTTAHRARAAAALEDAAAAAVVEDIAPDIADELRVGFDEIAEMALGGPPDDSLEAALTASWGWARVVAAGSLALIALGWTLGLYELFGIVGAVVGLGIIVLCSRAIVAAAATARRPRPGVEDPGP